MSFTLRFLLAIAFIVFCVCGVLVIAFDVPVWFPFVASVLCVAVIAIVILILEGPRAFRD